ncbi:MULTISPECIES: DUF4434 domain-containing protein [unclassified Streptomyces]|uniref:DUF4434 domain-containing protein n=1 Tax=unclassified Streptomyces TaxID=2593676 RepID=UPI002E2DBB32|nr:DUF4434 domain-containing protein [Streptomyces sp. NBC_00223]
MRRGLARLASFIAFVCIACLVISPTASATPLKKEAKSSQATHVRGQQPAPAPSTKVGPYHAVRPSTSELNAAKKAKSATPDFGPGEHIVSGWSAHKLSIDQMVRYGINSIIQPDAVPEEWRPTGALSELAPLYLTYLIGKSKQTSPATRSWVESLTKNLAADPSATSEVHPKYSPVHLEPAKATGSAQKLTADDSTDPSCGDSSVYDWPDLPTQHHRYYCDYITPDFNVLYNHGTDLPESHGANGIPSAIITIANAAEEAYGLYTTGDGLPGVSGMGYQEPSGRLTIFVGDWIHDHSDDGAAFTLPVGPGSQPSIWMPADPHDYDALVRHELFHAFQYQYISQIGIVLDPFAGSINLSSDFAALNWWMESTAQWATHRTYVLNPYWYFDFDPGWTYWDGYTANDYADYQRSYYAQELPDFFTAPEHAVNSWAGLGSGRQYGEFGLAEYLSEQTDDSDAVLRTWQSIKQDDLLPMDAINTVFAGYGLDFKQELLGFAAANYRMAGPASFDGFGESDTESLWPSVLENSTYANTHADSHGQARPARNTANVTTTAGGDVILQPGGAGYVDLIPTSASGGRRITVAVHAVTGTGSPSDTRFGLIPWYGSVPGHLIQGDSSGHVSAVVGNGVTFVTLVVERSDYVNSADSVPANSQADVSWYATSEAPARTAAQPDPAAAGRLGGSFIQPDLVDQWSDATLADEMADMKNLHISRLILQWSANTADSHRNGAKTAVYPTNQPGYLQVTSTDVVQRLLSAADTAGVEVWVGLPTSDTWWSVYAGDSSWLGYQGTSDLAVAHELWSRYHSHSSFKGWYLPLEMDNVHFSSSYDQNNMIDFYNQVIGGLRTVDDTMPVAVAPFYNAVNTALTGWQSASAWSDMWENILSHTDIDVVALQDGVGAGHADAGMLPTWFAAMKDAITAGHPSTVLYSDSETYIMALPGLEPMPAKTLVADLHAVENSVAGFWSFSFNHYLSLNSSLPTAAYFNAYQSWARTPTGDGDDGDTPSTPPQPSATVMGPQTVALSWPDSTDTGSGVAGYHIYRNGELVTDKLGSSGSYWDRQLDGGTTYTYGIQAFDGSGNTSAMSTLVSATTPALPAAPVNYARCGAPDGQPGCSYTSDTPADFSYPDTDGTSLTDGLYGADLYGPQWQGRNNPGTYSFTVDLGSERAIKEIDSSWFQVRQDYVFLPPQIRYLVSENGVDYGLVSSIDQPAISAGIQSKTYRAINVATTGRYVRIEVDGGTAWSMVNEVEVRGS